MSRSNIRIAASVVLVATAIFLLVSLAVSLAKITEPTIVEEQVDEATIRFEASRRGLILPWQCVTVAWDIEGIEAVFINGAPTVGHYEQVVCPDERSITTTDQGSVLLFILDVRFVDATQKLYSLKVEAMWLNPQSWLQVVGAVLFILLAGHLLEIVDISRLVRAGLKSLMSLSSLLDRLLPDDDDLQSAGVLARWIAFPWLFSIYPILFLYSQNTGLVFDEEVLQAVAIILPVVGLLFLILRWVIKDAHTSGLIVAGMLMPIFSYGHFINLLEMRNGPISYVLLKLMPTLLWPLLLAYLGLLVFGAIRIGKSKRRNTTRMYLNLMALVLISLPAFQIASYYVRTFATTEDAAVFTETSRPEVEIVKNSIEYRDIYYVILDAYSSNAQLQRNYGFDNSEFTKALEARGFFVAYESRSNYGVTLPSLASSLNMRYLDERDQAAADDSKTYLRRLIADNAVAEQLQARGYMYNYMLSGFALPSATADVNIDFFPDGPHYFDGAAFLGENNGSWFYKQSFWKLLLETTLFRSITTLRDEFYADRPIDLYAAKRALAIFDEAESIAEMEEATFTFVHIVKPHEPIVFDREGNVVSDTRGANAYFDQLHFINMRTLEMIDNIIANSSVPPILIIQADHGSDLGHGFREDGRATYFEILNAYYFPDGGDQELSATITPVNSFRTLLNFYFDAGYEYLDDRHYTMPLGYEDALFLLEVTDEEELVSPGN